MATDVVHLQKQISNVQSLLGKHVKKPQLVDKHLARPPFRFLHDIFVSVMQSTGFFDGLFTPGEIDSSALNTKEEKSQFLLKVIAVTRIVSGGEVEAKAGKVLAGQEPEKTLDLLLLLASTLEKGLSSKEAVAQVNGGSGSGSKTESKNKKEIKSVAEKDKKIGAKDKNLAPPKNPPSNQSGGNSQSQPKVSPRENATKSNIAPAKNLKEKDKIGAKNTNVSKVGQNNKVKTSNTTPVSNSKAGGNSKAKTQLGSKSDKKLPIASTKDQESEIEDEGIFEENVPKVSNSRRNSNANSSSRERGTRDVSKNKQGALPSESQKIFKNQSNDEEEQEGNLEELKNSFEKDGEENGENMKMEKGSKVDEEKPIDEKHEIGMGKGGKSSMSSSKESMKSSGGGGGSNADELPSSNELVEKSNNNIDDESSNSIKMPTKSNSNFPPSSLQTLKMTNNDDIGDEIDENEIDPDQLEPLRTLVPQKNKGPLRATPGTVTGISAENRMTRPPSASRPPTAAQTRPPSASTFTRPPSARPMSARTAPNRPMSALVEDAPTPYRPPTSRIPLILDSDKLEEEEEEEINKKDGILKEIFKESEMQLNLSELGGGEGNDGDYVRDSHLVKQMMDAKRALESNDEESADGDKKSLVEVDLEKLKTLIQNSARLSNPLRKILDLVQEDINGMTTEYTRFSAQIEKLKSQLESAKEKSQERLRPKRRELQEFLEKLEKQELLIRTAQNDLFSVGENLDNFVGALRDAPDQIEIPHKFQLDPENGEEFDLELELKIKTELEKKYPPSLSRFMDVLPYYLSDDYNEENSVKGTTRRSSQQLKPGFLNEPIMPRFDTTTTGSASSFNFDKKINKITPPPSSGLSFLKNTQKMREDEEIMEFEQNFEQNTKNYGGFANSLLKRSNSSFLQPPEDQMDSLEMNIDFRTPPL